MRATTGGELTLLHTPQRSEACKVEIIRNGTPVDVTGRVNSGNISFSADDRVATCDITFEDVYPAFGTTASLSPLLTGSSYNSPSALLWPNNEIKIYFGVDTLGSDATDDLKLAFHGVLGDRITPRSTPGGRTVSLRCRDLAKRLQDHWMKGELIYGDEDGTAVVAVIQGILNDCFTWDTSSSNYKKLHIKPAMTGTSIDGCDFVVYPMKVGNCTCWDAINKVIGCTAADDIGYELRYCFLPSGDTSTKDSAGDPITVSADGFYLCLVEIDQSNDSNDDTISTSTDSIEEHEVTIADDSIRNDIWGHYEDRFTHEIMEINRRDEVSISEYGQRTMVIGQDDVPFIDTHDEMWPLLGVALNALKDVPATDRFTTQLMYHVEPNDLLGTTSARLATGSTSVGITEIQHMFSPNGGPTTRQVFRTTFTGVRDVRRGCRKRFSLMTGKDDLSASLGENIGLTAPESNSVWITDNEGYTKTVLRVAPLPALQVEYYEWKWAIEGESVWKTETTDGPELVITGVPAGTNITWLARAKLKGGTR